MNAASNVLRILIIVLIGAVILGVLLIAAMVIFPGMSIFGIRFVSNSSELQKYSIHRDTEWPEVSALVIETNGWNVELRPFSNEGDTLYRTNGEDDNIRVLFYSQYTGIIKSKEKGDEKASYTVTYGAHLPSGGGQACIITTKEPDEVWLSKSNAKVVVLYDDGVLDNKKVYISTDSGSVYLGCNILANREQEKLKNVQIVSKNGHVTVGNIDVTETLDISKENGGLECKTNMTGNMKLSVNSGYGAIKLKNVGNPNAADDNISVNMDKIKNANIEFGTIYGDLQYMTGSSGLIRGEKVTGSLIVNSTDACVIKIKDIGRNVIFNSKAGNLFASKIGGDIESLMSGNGQIHVKALGGNSNIKAQGGKVALGENFKDSASTSFIGTKGDMDVESVGGEIYIKSAGSSQKFKVRSKNGFVQLVDVDGTVDYSVVDDGKTHIKMNYKALKGENIITTNNGAVELIVPTNVPANITWKSERETDISVSGLKTKNKSGSEGINGGSTTNTLNVTTNAGKISIKYE